MSNNLNQKYNVPGPRYTSYPTVPYWDEKGIDYNIWEETVLKSFKESNEEEGISLYIHLPFCACHKRITKRHEVESPYIETVLKEWGLYCDLLVDAPYIRELHLGGGTPTFFSAKNLKKLIDGIFQRGKRTSDFEYSYEGHPNNTSEEQLQVLFNLGFKRNSFGIQDYDPKVQVAINRVQSFENVEKVTQQSRSIGYESISHDLIFGLPHQTEQSNRETIEKTNRLRPDRIAYYSYAHVPWIKGNGQRGFDENDLPQDAEKRHLYELGKELFFKNGYVEIGMDHFALPTDSLLQAMVNKKLHRNFMGYTAGKTKLMIGLGASSISDSWYGFAQNIKKVEDYTKTVNEGVIPIFRGHELTKEDLIIRQHILNLMCQMETSWEDDKMKFTELKTVLSHLDEMVEDGLIEIKENSLLVKEEGRMYVRNVCMAFDLRLMEKKPNTQLFSMTI